MIGRTIAHFEITAKLGEGAMGAVWRASDTLLEREVALKLVSESLAGSADARRRLLQEARAASRLHHAGIATVYEAGESDGAMYIAQLLVDGETLATAMSHGRVSPTRAVVIASQVAAALAHAHGNGVLHRDISCRNIMLDEESRAVVVDFGLARVQERSDLTRPGTIMGTAAYVSPEVARGRPADQRSDLYGLGAVLYEMLAGRPPFSGDNVAAVLYAVVNEKPKRVTELIPAISPGLEQVVMRLLEKEPADRYASAKELALALRAVPELEQVNSWEEQTLSIALESLDPGAVGPTEDWQQRGSDAKPHPRRWSVWFRAALGLALLAIVAFLLTEWAPFQRRPSIESVAVIPFQLTGADPMKDMFLVDGIGSHLTSQLTQLGSFRVTPWITTQHYSIESKSAQEIAEDLQVDVLIIGSLQRSGGRIAGNIGLVDGSTGTQRWSTDFDKPVSDLFDLQHEVAVLAATRLKGQLSGAEEKGLSRPAAGSLEAYEHYLRGTTLLRMGRRQTNEQALSYFQRATTLDPALADAYAGMGNVYLDRVFYGWEGGWGNLALAEQSLLSALEQDPENMNALAGLVQMTWLRGDPSRDTLEVGERVRAMGRTDVDALFVRARSYIFGGLPDRAIPILREIIALDPANVGAAWFLVLAPIWAGDASGTVEAGRAFLARYGEDPEVHDWVGAGYHELGELEKADAHYRRSIQMFGDESNLYVFVHHARLLADMGDAEGSKAALHAALGQVNSRLERFPDNLRLIAARIGSLAMLGETERSRAEIDEVLATQKMPPALIASVAEDFIVSTDPERGSELALLACRMGSYAFQITNLPKMDSLWFSRPVRLGQSLQDALDCNERLGQKLRSEF